MKILFTMIPVILLATSCGKTEEEKTEEKVESANDKIEKLGTIATTLNDDYGVVVQSYVSFNLYNTQSGAKLSKLDYTECNKAKKLLTDYETLGQQVLSIANSDNIMFADRYKLEDFISNASTINNATTCISLEQQQENERAEQELASLKDQFQNAEDKLETTANVRFSTYLGTTEIHAPKLETMEYKQMRRVLNEVNSFINRAEILDSKISSSSDVREAKIKLAKDYREFLEGTIPVKHVSQIVTSMDISPTTLENLTPKQAKKLLSQVKQVKQIIRDNRSSFNTEKTDDLIESMNQIAEFAQATLDVEDTESTNDDAGLSQLGTTKSIAPKSDQL